MHDSAFASVWSAKGLDLRTNDLLSITSQQTDVREGNLGAEERTMQKQKRGLHHFASFTNGRHSAPAGERTTRQQWCFDSGDEHEQGYRTEQPLIGTA